MKNRIFINGVEIVDKTKNGRQSILWMKDGSKINSSKIYNEPVEIECHECNKKTQLKFYCTLFKRKYLCQSCIKCGKKNPFYGKKHSEEFKNRLSQERKGSWCVGEDNGMYDVNVWDTYDEKRKEEIKKKISDGQTGDKNHFFGKTHTVETRSRISKASKQYVIDHPEHIKKMTETSIKRQRSGLKTKIEKAIEVKLIELEIPYKYSKILHRKYQYDFIIGDSILLEVQGDYWHANPSIYGEGKKPLNETQQYKIKMDAMKKEFALKYGYKIFYIWETTINEKDFSIVYEIKKIIDEGTK